jgi:hypothetical protein
MSAAVRRPVFSHAYREYATWVLAERLSRRADDPTETTRRLLQFVHEQLNPEAGPARELTPWDTLVRGVGACDQAAVVAAHLLAARQIRARPVALRAADGSSPHSALEVELGGRWTFWDPHFGVEFSDAGSPASLAELSSNPARLEAAILWLPAPVEDRRALVDFYRLLLLPQREPTRWRSPTDDPDLLSRTLRGSGAALGRFGGEIVASWIQNLYLRLVSETCGVADECSSTGGGIDPDTLLWGRGRNLELFGAYRAAVDAYSTLLLENPGSVYALRARFRRGALLLGPLADPAGRADLVAVLEDPRAAPLWAGARRELRQPGPPPTDPRLRALSRASQPR